ncbi:MAG TPA: hypothetical protein VGP82_20635 [Ktedonobacterales bacterium]|nr:hypothetical protein [Ktedonobacterales bacterium]
MPTHDELEQFLREFRKLSPRERALLGAAVRAMVDDLKAGMPFRPSLRIKGVQGYQGIYEMSRAPDGRATFHYGQQVQPGEAHIIWRRIGSHDIFKDP